MDPVFTSILLVCDFLLGNWVHWFWDINELSLVISVIWMLVVLVCVSFCVRVYVWLFGNAWEKAAKLIHNLAENITEILDLIHICNFNIQEVEGGQWTWNCLRIHNSILPTRQNHVFSPVNYYSKYINENGQNYVHLSTIGLIDIGSQMRMSEKPEYCFHSKDRKIRGYSMSSQK